MSRSPRGPALGERTGVAVGGNDRLGWSCSSPLRLRCSHRAICGGTSLRAVSLPSSPSRVLVAAGRSQPRLLTGEPARGLQGSTGVLGGQVTAGVDGDVRGVSEQLRHALPPGASPHQPDRIGAAEMVRTEHDTGRRVGERMPARRVPVNSSRSRDRIRASRGGCICHGSAVGGRQPRPGTSAARRGAWLPFGSTRGGRAPGRARGAQ
jgi:hypothetical protein